MPTSVAHRNQSPDSQRKSIEWFQHKKSIDMKKANRNKISKPANLAKLVYELSGSGFESSCSHLNFRFRACFEQGVP